MSEPPRCLVCTGTVLDSADVAGNVAFFSCPGCDRRFARAGDGPLVERWGGPLSIALYGVQFSEDPAPAAERMATQLVAQTASDLPERLRDMVAAIDDELGVKRQPVREIIGASASEERLRDYLGRLADFLRNDAWVARQVADARRTDG